jgi:hypothetical protein
MALHLLRLFSLINKDEIYSSFFSWHKGRRMIRSLVLALGFADSTDAASCVQNCNEKLSLNWRQDFKKKRIL